MANYSPSKFPKCAEGEAESARQAAQLACYMCGDGSVSREDAFKACVEAFSNLCEMLSKSERLRRAGEQRASLLASQLKQTQEKLAESQKLVEILEGSAAFYGDDSFTHSQSTYDKNEGLVDVFQVGKLAKLAGETGCLYPNCMV